MILSQYKYETELATLYLISNEETLCGIYWKKQTVPMVESLTGVLKTAVRQLGEYLSSRRTTFDIPLTFHGTSFQKKVWNELQKLPFGETSSYVEIAHRIKQPNAARAVGTAIGRNPISIIVPCHRVIASDGSLAGYAGGLPIKTLLLALERRGSPSYSGNILHGDRGRLLVSK